MTVNAPRPRQRGSAAWMALLTALVIVGAVIIGLNVGGRGPTASLEPSRQRVGKPAVRDGQCDRQRLPRRQAPRRLRPTSPGSAWRARSTRVPACSA